MARIRKSRSETPQADRNVEVPEKWRICVYVRLSREDTRESAGENARHTEKCPRQSEGGRHLESESIKNQRSILLSWIEDYFEPGGYEIVGVFEEVKTAKRIQRVRKAFFHSADNFTAAEGLFFVQNCF